MFGFVVFWVAEGEVIIFVLVILLFLLVKGIRKRKILEKHI